MPIISNFPQPFSGGGVTPSSQLYKSNPNLLHNWYLADPINQRGMTEYTAAGYTIDRWKLLSGSLSVMDGFIRMTEEEPKWALQYKFDDYCVIPGYSYTLSFLLKSNKKFLFVIWYGASKYLTKEFEANSALEIKEFTFTMQTPDSGFRPSFIMQTLENDTVIDLTAAKLELGTQQTLAHQDAAGNWVLNDPPPNKALELAKCQRYFYRQKHINKIRIAQKYSGDHKVWISIPTPIAMRAKPTITSIGGTRLYTLKSEGPYSIKSYGVENIDGSSVTFWLESENVVEDFDGFVYANDIQFDANL